MRSDSILVLIKAYLPEAKPLYRFSDYWCQAFQCLFLPVISILADGLLDFSPGFSLVFEVWNCVFCTFLPYLRYLRRVCMSGIC